jgi:hypothetical protein
MGKFQQATAARPEAITRRRALTAAALSGPVRYIQSLFRKN